MTQYYSIGTWHLAFRSEVISVQRLKAPGVEGRFDSPCWRKTARNFHARAQFLSDCKGSILGSRHRAEAVRLYLSTGSPPENVSSFHVGCWPLQTQRPTTRSSTITHPSPAQSTSGGQRQTER